MFFRFSLIILLFTTFINAKEVLTSELQTGTIIVKIATSESKNKAKKVVQKFFRDYDILTLKSKYFAHYIVNIQPQDYKQTLSNLQKTYPTAFRSTKKIFETKGVLLLEEESFDANITSNDVNTTFLDTNTSFLESNISKISDTQELTPSYKNTKLVNSITTSSSTSNEEKPYLRDVKAEKTDLSKETNKIDLIDAVLQTLSISHKIKTSKEKMLQAKYNIDIAYGNYHPSVDVSYTNARVLAKPGDQQIDQSYAKTKYYNDEQFSLTLSQNIYAGGQTENEIERLKAQYMIAKTDYQRVLEEEIFKAVSSYIDVVFTRDAMKANEKNMKELETIFNIVKAKFDAGAVSLGELSNIEANVANAKSQYSKTSSKFNNALEYFKYIAGELFEETYPYEKIVHVKISPLEDILEDMPQKNLEIKSYNYDILSKKYNLKKLQAAFRPTVDLSLSAQKITDQEDYVFDEDTYTAQLSINYNLYNGNKDKNNYLKGFSSIQEKIFEKEGELRRIKWELEKLHISLTSLQDNLSNVEDEVNSSQNMVGSYWESFRNGEQDLHVLLQGQRQLNTAELDLIQSQQDSMKDYFEILKLSGDLLSFFQIDIDEPNYLDLARAKYRAQYRANKQDALSSILDESPILSKDNNTTQISTPKEEKLQTDLAQLLSFHERFLIEEPQNYTIVIEDFTNAIDGLKKIVDLNISNEAFIYENFEDSKIKTKIAFGIFNSNEEAKNAIANKLASVETKNFHIEKVQTVQDAFKEFSNLLLVDAKSIPKVVKPVKQIIKKEKVFETNKQFKEKFLQAPQEYYTINVTTLSSMKLAGELVKKEQIEENSFVFSYGNAEKWFKLMYGVFATYEEAQKALETLQNLEVSYLPVIEKISLKQELYKRFNEL